ncbi:MAG: C/D box methylation guide ribonucleoprotein complex aNOP56 subunit [Promethearchaeota archaeon]
MKCYIIDTLVGVFALDEIGNTINFIDFNRDNERVIEFYTTLDTEQILNEFKEFISDLKNSGFNIFIFDNKKMERLTSQKLEVSTKLNLTSLEFKNYRLNLIEQLKKVGISVSKDELLSRYKKINEELIKKKVSEVGGQKDIIIIQTNETLDIIKKSLSLFIARLREWYGLHFPELTDKVIDDNILITKLISSLGHRDNYTIDNLKQNFDFKEKRIQNLHSQAINSMGAEIDLEIVKAYANQILSLNSYIEELESYLEDLMEKTAPNLRAIVGSLIGAKLISKAGGLKKLAYMPASRIQLLGAEKALYRFLRTGEKRPKHGLIFQWNQIRSAKPYHRGKIARIVAGKLGLSAKVDFFSGEFIGDRLSREIEEKIKEVEEKYPNPPKKVDKVKNKKKRSKKRK